MHPQYSFIPLQSFVRLTLHFIPLQALSFLSLHSSRMMSAALNFFSGCSFAQPSGLAPFTYIVWHPFFNYRLSTFHYKLLSSLRPKSRNAKGCLLFLTRRFTLSVLHSTSQATIRSRPEVDVRLPQPRHCAPHNK